MDVYKIAYNNKSPTNHQVLMTIRIIPTHSDLSNISNTPKITNDLYFAYKINMGQVVKISSLDEKIEFTDCYINTEVHGKIEFQINKFFKIVNFDYNNTADNYYLSVYKYIIGALNTSSYINPETTGVKFVFYQNGKIQEKLYYKQGIIAQKHVYRNNEFNSLHYSYVYSDAGVLETEYEYSSDEALLKISSYLTGNKVTVPVNTLENLTSYNNNKLVKAKHIKY